MFVSCIISSSFDKELKLSPIELESWFEDGAMISKIEIRFLQPTTKPIISSHFNLYPILLGFRFYIRVLDLEIENVVLNCRFGFEVWDWGHTLRIWF
jgi:hypothetical protein